MSTMQIVFSIIGFVAIVAIVGHGMWTLRKNEQRQRQRVQDMELKRQQASSLDDGVGEVRVIAKRPQAPAAAAVDQLVQTPAADNLEMPSISVPVDDRRGVSTDEKVSTSVSKTEAVASVKAAPQAPAQQSMDLPVERSADEPILNDAPDEVIVLHVVGDIQGTVLLQQMTELGFKFGEFDIFHRHVDTAGNGPVLFSLANMFNPGSFVIEQIETFQTDGVALFLALPIKSNSLQAFTMMHNAAVKLAAAIGKGQVLDEHRNLLTRQAVQHLHQRIREYERKRLIRQP
jgi:cell division protein ZipA